MTDISVLVEKRKRLLNEFKSQKDFDLEKRLDALNKILEENNTEEEFLIEYLELKLKCQSGSKNKEYRDEAFRKDLETYEVGINKEDFNKKFGNYFLKKSAYEKLIDLFEKLRGIIYEESKEEQFLKIIEVLEMKNEKYEQTFPIYYSINKELYFNSLNYMLIKQIKKLFWDEDKEMGHINKNKIDLKIEEYKKKIDEIQNIGNLSEEEKSKKINGFNKIINYISLCFNSFSEYIDSLGIFIDEIFFNDFIFFLMRFNFYDEGTDIYISLWKEIFSPKIKEKKDYKSQNLILNYINNDLKIIYKRKNGTVREDTIKNIDYYLDELVDEIKKSKNKIDCFKTINYLKMDKYYSSIFIKSHWNELSNYIGDILLSPTLQQIYSSIYSSKNHIELNRDDIK